MLGYLHFKENDFVLKGRQTALRNFSNVEFIDRTMQCIRILLFLCASDLLLDVLKFMVMFSFLLYFVFQLWIVHFSCNSRREFNA